MSWNANARADIKKDGFNFPTMSDADVEAVRFLKGSRKSNLVVAGIAATIGFFVSNCYNRDQIVSWQNLGVTLALGYCGTVAIYNSNKFYLKTKREKIVDAANGRVDEIFSPLDKSSYSLRNLELVIDKFLKEKESINESPEQPYVSAYISAGQKRIEELFLGQFNMRLVEVSEVDLFLGKLKHSIALDTTNQQEQELRPMYDAIKTQPGLVNEIAKYVFMGSTRQAFGYDTEERVVLFNNNVFQHVQESLYQVLENALVNLAFLSRKTDEQDFVKSQIDINHRGQYSAVINRPESYCQDRFVKLVTDIPVFRERFEADLGEDTLASILTSFRNNEGLSENLCQAVAAWSKSRSNLSGSGVVDDISSAPPVISAIHPRTGRTL